MDRYSVIYAEPPLRVDDTILPGMRIPGPVYHPESFNRLAKYDISRLAEDDAALFLWCGAPVMPEAMMLMDDWGFPYRSIAFVWEITNWKEGGIIRGQKRPTRANCKFLLYGAKGDPSMSGRDIDQLVRVRDAAAVRTPRRVRKAPNVFREKVTALAGDVPRIHLWASEHSPEGDKWHVWGPDIDSDILFLPKRK